LTKTNFEGVTKKELLLKYIMSVGMDKFKKERVSLEQTAKNLLINKLN
jgi:hypothetical protein